MEILDEDLEKLKTLLKEKCNEVVSLERKLKLSEEERIRIQEQVFRIRFIAENYDCVNVTFSLVPSYFFSLKKPDRLRMYNEIIKSSTHELFDRLNPSLYDNPRTSK